MKYKFRESNPSASQTAIDLAISKLESRIKMETHRFYNCAVTNQLVSEVNFILDRELEMVCDEYCLCRPNVKPSASMTDKGELQINYVSND